MVLLYLGDTIRIYSKFISLLTSDQEKIFVDNFSHKQWRKICQKADLSDLKFHDLRKTFGSLLAQNGIENPSSRCIIAPLLRHTLYSLLLSFFGLAQLQPKYNQNTK